MNRFLPPAVLGALLLACAQPAPEASAPAAAAVDTAAVVAGINGVWAKWVEADTAENLDAFAALLTETARIDGKGMPPIVGPEGMKVAAGPLYSQVDYLEAGWNPTTTVAITNELGHQAGTYFERYTVKGKKGEMMDYGRYAAAFVKTADGQWKYAYMMAFVDSTVTKK